MMIATHFENYISPDEIRDALNMYDTVVEDATVFLANLHMSLSEAHIFFDFDAEMMLSLASWIERGKRLTPKQIAVARKKLTARYTTVLYSRTHDATVKYDADKKVVTSSAEVHHTEWTTSVSMSFTDALKVVRNDRVLTVEDNNHKIFGFAYDSVSDAEEAENFINRNLGSEQLRFALRFCNGR